MIRAGQLVQGGQILQLPRHAAGQYWKSRRERSAGETHQRVRCVCISNWRQSNCKLIFSLSKNVWIVSTIFLIRSRFWQWTFLDSRHGSRWRGQLLLDVNWKAGDLHQLERRRTGTHNRIFRLFCRCSHCVHLDLSRQSTFVSVGRSIVVDDF